MQPIRKIINDAPPMLPLPTELHHKRLEIIIWPLDAQSAAPHRTFKTLLMNMPNVGDDDDFAHEVALRAYRLREGLTQKRLAELTGIPQHHISEMENGKRSIGKERARKLAAALHCDYRQFL